MCTNSATWSHWLIAVCYRVLQGVAVCCSVLQCVVVCCSVLHSVYVYFIYLFIYSTCTNSAKWRHYVDVGLSWKHMHVYRVCIHTQL